MVLRPSTQMSGSTAKWKKWSSSSGLRLKVVPIHHRTISMKLPTRWLTRKSCGRSSRLLSTFPSRNSDVTKSVRAFLKCWRKTPLPSCLSNVMIVLSSLMWCRRWQTADLGADASEYSPLPASPSLAFSMMWAKSSSHKASSNCSLVGKWA